VRKFWEKLQLSQPLVPLAVSATLGIALARVLELPLSNSIIALAISVVLLMVGKLWRYSFLLLVFFWGTAAIYSGRYEILSSADLRLLLEDKEKLAVVQGTLLESPSVRETHYGTKTNLNSVARVRISQIQIDKKWEEAEGTIAISTHGELRGEFFPGQIVEVMGVAQMPPKAAAPGLFDYREYLYNQRIFYTLRSESSNDWRILSSPKGPPITEKFRRWAKHQLARGVPAEDESLKLIWAMALGWQSSLSGEMSDPFMRTGTMHIFAISGLHVACISGLFLIVARFAGLPRHLCGFAIIPLLWFYVLATGWQSSSIRSAIMSSVVIAGWTMKRPSVLMNSTAAAALLILVFQPEQLFQTSFQLSFAVVASMALLVPGMEHCRAKLLAADPFLPPELWSVPEGIRHRFLHYVSVSFVVSLASWVGSLPIVAYYFNMVTPVSLLANLFAVPLSSISLAFTVLSILIPPVGPFFNWVSWAFMWATVWVTKFFAIVPGGYLYVPKPNWELFGLYFAVVGAMISGTLWNKAYRRWALSIILAMAAGWTVSILRGSRAPEITMLAAAGTPLYVDFPGKENDLLIDCSTERDADFVVKRFLHAQGAGSVRNLLVTHGDINHAQGFFQLDPEFSPVRIFTTPAKARSPTYKKVLKVLEERPAVWRKVARGDSIGVWQVLHPASDRSFPRADDNSIVLKASIRGWRVLFLGDLGERGQDELLKNEHELQADVVISGLPERDEPLNEQLLAKLNSKVIIVGSMRFPMTDRPGVSLQERLSRFCPNVFFAHKEGSVQASFSKEWCKVISSNGRSVVLHR
jgi:competence protein ComEC